MRLTPLCAVLLLLAGCHDSGGGGGGAPPLLTNHGLAAFALQGSGELWLVSIDEATAGDLNGDGDDLDLGLAVLDLADGSLTSLALAHSPLPGSTVVGTVLIAIGVPETDQGFADLNGDGDLDDVVLHVYDSFTRTTTNTGLALGPYVPAIGAGAVVFAVSEAGQGGTDLDGSGSALGNVLHVHDSRTGLVTNAQRNVTSGPVFHDHAFAFTTDEASAGSDLNGDGDQDDDAVFQTFDTAAGGVLGVPLAVTGAPLGALIENWYVLADEAAQGVDLNGDLDLSDAVLLALEPHLVTVQPTGITCRPVPFGRSDGQRLAVLASEDDGVDRNGDADLDDTFVALLQPGLAPLFVASTPLDLLAPAPLALTTHGVAFLASEDEVGDLNGNGVPGETSLFTLDAATGAVEPAFAEVESLAAAGAFAVFARHEESGTLAEDRNGDGDVDDLVHSLLDMRTGARSDTGLAAVNRLVTSSRALLVLADEAAQGADLNGDGDTSDLVWVRYDLLTGTSTPLAASLDLPGTAGLADDGRGVLLVAESETGPFPGTDMNGDGDTLDLVLHSFGAP